MGGRQQVTSPWMTHRLVERHPLGDRKGDEVALHQRAVAPDLRGGSPQKSATASVYSSSLQLDLLRFGFGGLEFEV